MGKKLGSLAIIITVLFAFVFGAAACDSNQGRIQGLDNAQFVAHIGRGAVITKGYPFIGGIAQLINSRDELWNFMNDRTQLVEQGLVTQDNWLDFEYSDSFFEANQLIAVNFEGYDVPYEISSISYVSNTLTIEFITVRRHRNINDLAVLIPAIIEITRISYDLNIVVSSRMR